LDTAAEQAAAAGDETMMLRHDGEPSQADITVGAGRADSVWLKEYTAASPLCYLFGAQRVIGSATISWN
jgi:hypothetical protein